MRRKSSNNGEFHKDFMPVRAETEIPVMGEHDLTGNVPLALLHLKIDSREQRAKWLLCSGVVDFYA